MPKKRRKRKTSPRQGRGAPPAKPPVPAAGDVQQMYLREMQADERVTEIPAFQVDGVRCPEVMLDGPEVKEYADLVSMRMDLDHVIDLCEQRIEIAAHPALSSPERTTAMRATWEAAVIAYGRAFVGGVSLAPRGGGRTRFPEAILDQLDEQQRALHAETMELRNKHVGHRVNRWTQVIVTAVLNPETKGERSVLHVGTKVLTMVGGGPAAEQLRDLAVVLRDGLIARTDALEADILAQLKEQPVDDIYEDAAADAARGAQVLEAERKRRGDQGGDEDAQPAS